MRQHMRTGEHSSMDDTPSRIARLVVGETAIEQEPMLEMVMRARRGWRPRSHSHSLACLLTLDTFQASNIKGLCAWAASLDGGIAILHVYTRGRMASRKWVTMTALPNPSSMRAALFKLETTFSISPESLEFIVIPMTGQTHHRVARLH
jgi:hypothetical protein